MNRQINFIARKRLAQYHSIEELFLNVSNELKDQYEVQWIELPESGASLSSIIKNLNFVKKVRGQVYHITGDVNYMAIKFGEQSILTIHDIQSGFNGKHSKKKNKRVCMV